ncbi:MAG: O-antigen ligase family protein, partial [Chloroflexales bacterium]|nr:O-antigen ligase family protein [Chloroflexales bacterium]
AGAGAVALAILGGRGLLPDAVVGRLASLAGNLRLFDARGADITPANFAVVERMAHMQAGWNMLTRYPVTGVGPGNYSVAYERPPGPGERPLSVRPWYESRGHAHNYYLHIAAEAGLVGLAAYLLLIGATAAQAVRAIRAAPTWPWQGVAAGGAGVVAAVAAHNLFENLHVLNMGLQLGSVWALLVIAERARGEEQHR